MRTSKSTVMRRAGSICVLAVAAALTMTACSDDSEDPADTTSDAGESQEPDESEEPGDSEESGESPESEAPQEEQAAGQATGSEAVATWVAAIVEDRPLDACLVMGAPGDDGSPAGNTAAMCEDGSPGAEQARQLVSTLAESFTPESLGEPAAVEVAEGQESGGTATFDGQQITVDGQTIEEIVVSNSTGVEPGQIGIEIEATDIDSLWYVTDFDLSFG